MNEIGVKMVLSSYTRTWLEGTKGPRLREVSDYINSLEAEIKRLNPGGNLSPVVFKQSLLEHINENYNGNQTAFAASVGTNNVQVRRWLGYGCEWDCGEVKRVIWPINESEKL
tara:strand:- start:1558 stop:1896 length:339 start_codon:yes stop_codon:yes gene_type:complete